MANAECLECDVQRARESNRSAHVRTAAVRPRAENQTPSAHVRTAGVSPQNFELLGKICKESQRGLTPAVL
ncbi:MAG TPA: hypothetical protein VGQ81_00815, partial [Acidobacteriota bacterium]|nr:hypothetical protein [Acidobacteriota bacterium]